jgi:hypothetical protein
MSMAQFSTSYPKIHFSQPDGWSITESNGEKYLESILKPSNELSKPAFTNVIIRLTNDPSSLSLPSQVEQFLIRRKKLSKFDLLSQATDLMGGEEAIILDMAYQLPETLDSLRLSWQTVLEKRALAVQGSVLIEIILTAPLGEFSSNLGVFWQVLRSIHFGEDTNQV